MKKILALGCLTALALIVMDTTQVVKAPAGLTVKAGQAFAADLPQRMPPPPPAYAAPIGKGKAPWGKGKAPIMTKG